MTPEELDNIMFVVRKTLEEYGKYIEGESEGKAMLSTMRQRMRGVTDYHED